MESATTNYGKDLEAMSEEQLLTSAGGAARIPVDFTYEVALINRRIAARLSGNEPPAMPDGDEWIVAPVEFRNKEAISAYMSSACQELLDAGKSLSEEDSSKMVGPKAASALPSRWSNSPRCTRCITTPN